MYKDTRFFQRYDFQKKKYQRWQWWIGDDRMRIMCLIRIAPSSMLGKMIILWRSMIDFITLVPYIYDIYYNCFNCFVSSWNISNIACRMWIYQWYLLRVWIFNCNWYDLNNVNINEIIGKELNESRVLAYWKYFQKLKRINDMWQTCSE